MVPAEEEACVSVVRVEVGVELPAEVGGRAVLVHTAHRHTLVLQKLLKIFLFIDRYNNTASC